MRDAEGTGTARRGHQDERGGVDAAPRGRAGMTGRSVRSYGTPAAVLTALALTLTGCGTSHADGAGGSGAGDSGGSGARLSVRSAYMPRPVSDSLAAGFLTVVNDGGSTAYLTSVTSDAAADVTVHESVDGRMEEADRLGIPAHGRLVLASGGNHLMFEKLTHRFAEGETVTVRLHFADAAPITVRMPVKAATYRPATTASGS